MRRIEKKKLMIELTRQIGTKFQILNLEGWTDKEIYEKTGIPQSRITEIKNFDRYNIRITEWALASLISAGFITVNELKEKVTGLSKEGEEFIDDLAFYKNKELRKVAQQASRMGIDVVSLIKKEIENKKT